MAELRITLETYVHWWPKNEKKRGLVGNALKAADLAAQSADQTQFVPELCQAI